MGEGIMEWWNIGILEEASVWERRRPPRHRPAGACDSQNRPPIIPWTLLNLCQTDYLPSNIQGDNPGWKAMWKGKAIPVIGQQSHTARIIDPNVTLEDIKDENGDITIYLNILGILMAQILEKYFSP